MRDDLTPDQIMMSDMAGEEIGRVYEGKVQFSFDQYSGLKFLHAQKNYPSYSVQGVTDKARKRRGGGKRLRQKIHEVILTGKGPPDFTVMINAPYRGGLYLEVKAWQREDKMLYRERIHQAHTMKNALRDGACHGAYLVAWRTKHGDDWRLYDISQVKIKVDRKGEFINFSRVEGYPIPSGNGWPEWLSVYLDKIYIGSAPGKEFGSIINYLSPLNLGTPPPRTPYL